MREYPEYPEYPDNHRRLLDGGDDLELTAALRAVFEVQVEDALEQARPAHARRRVVRMFICRDAGIIRAPECRIREKPRTRLYKLRQARSVLRLDLGEERLEMFPHQAMQDRFLRPPPLVMDRARRRGAQHGFAFPSYPDGNARTAIAGHRDLARAEKIDTLEKSYNLSEEKCDD